MRILAILFIIILTGAGCTTRSSNDLNMEKITLTTDDGIELSADYYPAKGDRFALLLHMMPAEKSSWNEFALELQKRGVSSLAFDQRGHGKSDGGPNGYKSFTDSEQKDKIFDVRAGISELKKRGAKDENIVLVGASIGANLAIVYQDENKKIPLVVALSPGLDYRSVKTESAVKRLNGDKKMLLIASEEDTVSFGSILELEKLNNRVEIVKKSGLGHGTTMTENDADLMKNIIDWIDKNL